MGIHGAQVTADYILKSVEFDFGSLGVSFLYSTLF